MYLPASLYGTANKSFFKKQYLKDVKCACHMHYHMEIVFVTEGELVMKMGEETRRINKGFATLIWPFENHSFETPEASQCVVLEISPELISDFYDRIKDKRLFCSVFALEDLSAVGPCLSLPNGVSTDTLMTKAALYPLCFYMYSSLDFQPAGKTPDSLFVAAALYIEKHFAEEDLSLVSVAKALGVHHVYLSRLFGSNTGISFTKYLAMLRCVIAATKLTSESDRTVSEIAFECGFGSIRSFNRQFFDVFETTPTEYRNESK